MLCCNTLHVREKPCCSQYKFHHYLGYHITSFPIKTQKLYKQLEDIKSKNTECQIHVLWLKYLHVLLCIYYIFISAFLESENSATTCTARICTQVKITRKKKKINEADDRNRGFLCLPCNNNCLFWKFYGSSSFKKWSHLQHPIRKYGKGEGNRAAELSRYLL